MPEMKSLDASHAYADVDVVIDSRAFSSPSMPYQAVTDVSGPSILHQFPIHVAAFAQSSFVA